MQTYIYELFATVTETSSALAGLRKEELLTFDASVTRFCNSVPVSLVRLILFCTLINAVFAVFKSFFKQSYLQILWPLFERPVTAHFFVKI